MEQHRVHVTKKPIPIVIVAQVDITLVVVMGIGIRKLKHVVVEQHLERAIIVKVIVKHILLQTTRITIVRNGLVRL